MQQNYSKKIEPIQKASKNTASSVLDASSQSEALQRKADMASNAAQREETPRPNNTGMPDNLKSGIESLSGFSMDDVRVHYNSSKPATVQALAYTQGTDIHVAPGQEKNLPHEAWHVAQQMAGRVSPTTNINGMPVNDNAGLEHEADVMGEKAVQRKENVEIKSKNAPREALQLKPGEENDMVCAADILYRDCGDNLVHVKGVGYNNPDDRKYVLDTFEAYGLSELANVTKQGQGNEPGQCAEPHAVADALTKIPPFSNLFGNLFNNHGLSEFLDIYVSETVVRKKNRKFFEQTGDDNVNTFSRCETCAQWIGSDGHVYKNYLNNGAETGLIEQSREYSKEKQIRLEKYKKESDGQGRMMFGVSKYNNVDFLNHEIELPEWFKEDDDVKSINNQSGLRTIIKKQMLKNRAKEILILNTGVENFIIENFINNILYPALDIYNHYYRGTGKTLSKEDRLAGIIAAVGKPECVALSSYIRTEKPNCLSSIKQYDKFIGEIKKLFSKMCSEAENVTKAEYENICKKIDKIAETKKISRLNEKLVLFRKLSKGG